MLSVMLFPVCTIQTQVHCPHTSTFSVQLEEVNVWVRVFRTGGPPEPPVVKVKRKNNR